MNRIDSTGSPRPLHVVVLAAGRGRRMRSPLPKVLAPLAGETLLHQVLASARELSPAAIHVVVGHGAEAVREVFAEATDLHWVVQAEQLGTGHAVSCALPKLPPEALVLVLLGDMPLVRRQTLGRLVEAGAGGLAILTARLAEPGAYGRVVRGAGGEVQAIVESRDADPRELAIDEVNAGFLCAPGESLAAWLGQLRDDNAQGEYYLTDVVSIARAEGRAVDAVQATDPEEVLGANDRWQLAMLERALQRRRARELCEAGATLCDPARIEVRGSLRVEPGVLIDVGCVFEGECELAAGTHIGAHCVLRDSRLGPGTRVHPHSVLEGVRSAGDCDIGPFARLRPGTELARASRIGNFVETKKLRLGEGSKANHLTYLGDTEIGTGVNVGAGTITCNYDGVDKHRTRIDDGAFIGSGTQLVAPVTVGAGATIGAGSTITRDAPREQLSLARARQVTVTGWRRPARKED